MEIFVYCTMNQMNERVQIDASFTFAFACFQVKRPQVLSGFCSGGVLYPLIFSNLVCYLCLLTISVNTTKIFVHSICPFK